MSRTELIIRMICGGVSVSIALWLASEIGYGVNGIRLSASWLIVIGIVSVLIALLLGIKAFRGKTPLLDRASFVGVVTAVGLFSFGIALLGSVFPGQFILIK